MSISLTQNMSYFAFVFAVLAAGFLLLNTRLKQDWQIKVGKVLSVAGAACIVVAVGARMAEMGRLPVNNVYEFTLMFSMMVFLFTVFWLFRIKIYPVAAITLAIVAVLLGISFVIADSAAPLMPALQSKWRVIHVMTAIIAYSAFAVSFGIGIYYLIVMPTKNKMDKLTPELVERGDKLEKSMYNIVVVGFVFLTLLIITGAAWAEEAWGAWWSWDPKETWALITWIIYAIYLHLHLKPAWRGRKGCILCVVGFACVIFTLVGVSYLMGGLHSYG